MRRLGRILGRILAVLAMVAAAVWFWPADPPAPARFDAAALPEDLDGWLAAREAVFSDITEGAQKRVIWATEPGARTPLAIVYLHGFSATSEETRPVPDNAAAALGANLFFTRLAGHGRGGEALGAASADDWMTDLAEALAIGARIGDRVVIMATSTGAALTVAGLGTPDLRASLPGRDRLAGVVFVSPNFRLRSAVNGAALDLPLAQHWLPLVAGASRSYPARNEAHAKYWTTSYPTKAVFPMAQMMRAARAADPTLIKAPLLMIWSDADQVVNPEAARAIASRWGGPVSYAPVQPGPGMDHEAHVIAGDIRSPGMTESVSAIVIDWVGGL